MYCPASVELHKERALSNHGDVSNREEPQAKRPWEPMTLTRVGNLGAVIQSMMGSGNDGGTGMDMMA
jgi:hypothetical protein